jgi:hypothetical protein
MDDKEYVSRTRTKTTMVDGLREMKELRSQSWKLVDDEA